jgi:phenylalanyl-tRNA synthetase beta chain
MKISYKWLCELASITLGPKELAERLTMVGLAVDSVEGVGDDHILDFDITSNRPDALSHLGIAREAALVCGTSLKPNESRINESEEAAHTVASVEILDPDLCPRYAARVIRGVRVGPSPKWLVDRLESVGQRSVNNIADITNYVMFEMGQPTHAFDLNLLHQRRIVVRRAREGEQITTLDGGVHDLTAEMLVIADANRPVAVAGIMGGLHTEINLDTTDVLLESAYFNPASVRSTARRLGLDTEASYRFARGADYDAQVRAADRVAALIAEMAGGQVLRGAIDAYPAPIRREPVWLRESRVERLTGMRANIERAAEILRALRFTVKLDDLAKRLRAEAPSYRIDISREEDLVEEVARHVGYELIEATLPAWSGAGQYLPGDSQRRRIRDALTMLGFDEAYTFSFVNGDRDQLFRLGDRAAITLANPIDVNENVMRTSLVTGLVESMHRNFNHGRRDVKLFEMGRVFEESDGDERPLERELLGLAMSGAAAPDDWRLTRALDFYDLKGAVETVLDSLNLSGFTIDRASVEYLHPGQSAVLMRDGVEVARLGRLHPRLNSLYKFRQPVFVAEVELGRLLGLGADEVCFSALPRVPTISRDVSALLPDSVSWSDVQMAISELAISEIVEVALFDTYKGDKIAAGARSLAFRVTYRGDGRTLTDEEVAGMHERVRDSLQRLGAQLR